MSRKSLFRELFGDWEDYANPSTYYQERAREFLQQLWNEFWIDFLYKKIMTAIYVVLKRHKIKNIAKILEEIRTEFFKSLTKKRGRKNGKLL